MTESYAKDDAFRPFSNGTEYRMWLGRNCERKCRKYNPNASSSRHGCPIEVALALANIDSGEIKVKHALRAGMLVPGEGGRLERADEPDYWKCAEYQGPDDPDPPRRRHPKPPEDQLDIFDPRNAPARERVTA